MKALHESLKLVLFDKIKSDNFDQTSSFYKHGANLNVNTFPNNRPSLMEQLAKI